MLALVERVPLYRPAAYGANPIFPGKVHGGDLSESRLAQQLAVLRVAQKHGAQRRHDYAVKQPERPAAVGFGDQNEDPRLSIPLARSQAGQASSSAFPRP
jgi:hypothetical protein